MALNATYSTLTICRILFLKLVLFVLIVSFCASKKMYRTVTFLAKYLCYLQFLYNKILQNAYNIILFDF